MNSTNQTAAKFKEELNQSTENKETKKQRHSTHENKLGETLKKKWESKVLDGQYIRSVDRQLIGGETCCSGCGVGDLKGENESEIIAA
jgi:hypothetical protein